MKKFFAVLLLLMLPALFASAQSAYRSDTTRTSSYVNIGIRYRSDYFYMGRSDSIKAPYVIPSIGYYHRSGFFISGALSFLTAESEDRVDLITVSGGYDYFGNRFAAGLSVDQFFFNDLSYAVQAEMSTYLSGYAGYDLHAFMITVDGSLGISDELDFFLGGELSRTFRMYRNRFSLTPSLYTNMGTQQYYNQYYMRRTLTTGGTGNMGKGRGKGTVSPGTSFTEIRIAESEKFKVLDYEAGLQAAYNVGKLRVMVSGTFLFPVNPSTIVTEEGTFEEDLQNGFLWSAGVRYRISLR